MRVGIIHDYLAQAGGAERVIEAMHPVFPDAPIFTSVYDPKSTLACFHGMDIRTSFLQKFKFARSAKWHKLMLPLYPMAFESFDFSGYDVLVSNTTGFAKGVISGPETCHIAYCHTPARFAWRYHEYLAQGNYSKFQRGILPLILHFLRNWDYAAAQTRVDYFLANSYNIARRVRKYYGRSSRVLYPPVETDRFAIASKPQADFFLIVSRMMPYKRIDLAIEACNLMNMPLKVVGTGPDFPRLKAMAGPTVEMLGRQPDAEVVRLMRECKAFLFPGEEDFGIAPVEAMASGRPVVAYRAGGALETVVENQTGLFFDEPNVTSLVDAMRRLERMDVDSAMIRRHAIRFDIRHFQDRLRLLVSECKQEHTLRYGCIAPEFGRDDSPLAPRSMSEHTPIWCGDTMPVPQEKESIIYAGGGR